MGGGGRDYFSEPHNNDIIVFKGGQSDRLNNFLGIAEIVSLFPPPAED